MTIISIFRTQHVTINNALCDRRHLPINININFKSYSAAGIFKVALKKFLFYSFCYPRKLDDDSQQNLGRNLFLLIF